MPEFPIFNCKNSDDVVKAVREHKVELVQFWFVDVLGTLKASRFCQGSWKPPSKKAWASTDRLWRGLQE